MPAPGRPAQKLDVTWSLRISSAARKEAEHAGKRLQTNDQDAMRLAADIGFKFLRLIDYDVAGSVTEMALRLIAERAKKGKD